MVAARVCGSPKRAGRLLGSGALLAGVFLGGCTGVPEPAPFLPSPPPTTATAPAATAPASGSSSFRELQAMLELYSGEVLQEGAPAVLIEAKVGREKWSHAAGVRSRDGGVPVQAGDPVQVGGITRTMVAVSVLKLVDEGRLALDEPVGRHLPELEGLLRPPTPVTVRQLLGHTSGMPDYYAPLLESAPLGQVLATPLTPEKRLALAGTVPWQLGEPQGFSFSRSDYVALGLLVERLRGRPLADVLRADIVEPLGLRSTSMIGDGPAPANLVHGYTLADGGLVDVAYPALQDGSASDGMISTVEDVNTFYAALLRGELLSPAGLIEMKGRIYADYGLGLDQWNDRCTNGFYHGHSGDMPGYGAIAISSADGHRQLAMSVAYPPSAVPERSHAIVLEMTVLAQRALNASCSFQFWWTPPGD
ncbi:serine hydrolase [Arthrobacter sp. CJ23]|uniref:serine hydrolase domain-containing protein n=1 Tax=Arthrobacter sp. CJ23 TaxID=2972479 RepID=UPI00215CAF3A|nr:serine hydrolase domain-containing protein [Arthrobacter sp. CJ23]UVJ38878.1 beta-lactamase family protein [Arthrobacter sp. CJ23]